MTTRDALMHIVDELSDDRIVQLLDYARYLTWQEERRAWLDFGRSQLAKAYGDEEPDYSESDLQKDPSQ
ncbi:MAG: hypothetical protein HUU20_04860 [Pirellulales bacterium]|nr:hypothetical protein [Pirellulales bacterium]